MQPFVLFRTGSFANLTGSLPVERNVSDNDVAKLDRHGPLSLPSAWTAVVRSTHWVVRRLGCERHSGKLTHGLAGICVETQVAFASPLASAARTGLDPRQLPQQGLSNSCNSHGFQSLWYAAGQPGHWVRNVAQSCLQRPQHCHLTRADPLCTSSLPFAMSRSRLAAG